MHFQIVDSPSLKGEFSISSAAPIIILCIGHYLTIRERIKFASTSKKIKASAFSTRLDVYSGVVDLASFRHFLAANPRIIAVELGVMLRKPRPKTPPAEIPLFRQGETKENFDGEIKENCPVETKDFRQEVKFPSCDGFELLREFFPKLVDLHLDCDNPRLDWFPAFINLEVLTLVNCKVNITPQLPKLRNLVLRNCSGAFSLDFIRASLVEIILDGRGEFDLTQLTNLPQLKGITLRNISVITIPDFDGCPNLETLVFFSVTADRLPQLGNLPSLTLFKFDNESVDYHDADYQMFDLTGAGNCLALKNITLFGVDVATVMPLQSCLALEEISIKEAESLVDISPIVNLPHIREIFIDSEKMDVSNIYDFSPTLVRMELCGQIMDNHLRLNPKLQHLGLQFQEYRNGLSCLDSPLSRENLTSLNFVKFGQVIEEKDIGHFTNLEKIALNGEPDLKVFLRLLKLKNIGLYHNNTAIHLNELKNCTQVTELSLMDDPNLSDIEVVKNLPVLDVMYMDNCPAITDVSVLASCSMLTNVIIMNCGIPSLMPLANCSNLRRLYVKTTIVFSELPILPFLEDLSLDNCRGITSLAVLKASPKLKWLELLFCDNLDLTPLTECLALEEATLAMLTPCDVTVLRVCPKFKRLTTGLALYDETQLFRIKIRA